MSAASGPGSEASAAQAAGETGNAGTPGQADEAAELERESAARKLEFDNWFGSQGYDDEGRFDSDEMEFAFEAGREAAAAREPQTAPGLAAVEAERDKLQRACETLGKAVVWQAETLYCAWIEISRGDLPSAAQWILNGIPDVDDNPPDQQWNGTETAQEWFDRTREGE